MMFLAKHRGSVPKNLGIDLLILKDKRKHEETYASEVEKTDRVLVAIGAKKPAELDEQGMFRVFVDRAMQNIVVTHFASTISEKSDLTVNGKTADVIYSKIIELGLISLLDHAAYLGSELAKAEIALRTGKEYIQDQPMFKKQGLA
jgi:dihydropteroate synthase-like protein